MACLERDGQMLQLRVSAVWASEEVAMRPMGRPILLPMFDTISPI
jgi:hypothetical protein